MTFKEKWWLLTKKKDCMRILIFRDDKRVDEKIVLVKGNKFEIGEEMYSVESEKVRFHGGIPFLVFLNNNPEALNPSDIQKSNISAEEYYGAINQNIMIQILRYASDGDKKILNAIYIANFVGVGVLGLGLYLLFDKISIILSHVEEIKALLEQIQQIINSGLLS